MDIKHWVALFGKPVDDPKVRQALVKARLKIPSKLRRDELDARDDIEGEGTTVVFTDESVIDPNGKEGRPILSAVSVFVQNSDATEIYKGPLPYDLKTSDTQAALRKRFGKPVMSNATNRTDAWMIDGLMLAVSFAEDLKSIKKVGIRHPESQ